MMLTDTKLRAARCPEGKPRLLLHDGGGLYAVIGSAGTVSWQVRTRAGDKQVKKVIGEYPKMSLAKARVAAIEFKAAQNADASTKALTRTLHDVYLYWYEHWSPGKSPRTTMYA